MGIPIGLKIDAAGLPAILRQQNGRGTSKDLHIQLWAYVYNCQECMPGNTLSEAELFHAKGVADATNSLAGIASQGQRIQLLARFSHLLLTRGGVGAVLTIDNAPP
jgi:hypothetical protein